MSENSAAATPLSPAALAEIEARCNAATEGPWFVEHGSVMNAARSYEVALFGESEQDTIDAAFIACSISDVAALVGEVRRLRTALQAARNLKLQRTRLGASAAEKEHDQ